MKRSFFGCCLLVLLIASCVGGKKKVNPFEKLTEEIDSVNIHHDSVAIDTLPPVEEIIPATADECFADFFYNFASDSRFQRKRIVSPISSYKGDKVIRTKREDWEYDPLFSRDQFYTVIFDKEADMEKEKDLDVQSVQVDMIYLKPRTVKRYYFEKIKESWYLEAVNKEKLAHVKSDANTEDFFDFYERFSTDSVFQKSRLQEPLAFVTIDPEDEFQILEATLDDEQWFSFRPPLLHGKLTNVHYGQREEVDSNSKIIEFKGFGNGFSNTLYFERRNGLWKLVKFEDLSD